MLGGLQRKPRNVGPLLKARPQDAPSSHSHSELGRQAVRYVLPAVSESSCEQIFASFVWKNTLLKKKNGYGMDLLSCRLERTDWMVT